MAGIPSGKPFIDSCINASKPNFCLFFLSISAAERFASGSEVSSFNICTYMLISYFLEISPGVYPCFLNGKLNIFSSTSGSFIVRFLVSEKINDPSGILTGIPPSVCRFPLKYINSIMPSLLMSPITDSPPSTSMFA